MNETQVIVYGAGNLGLGLLGAQAGAAGHPLSLVGRTGSRKPIPKKLQEDRRFVVLTQTREFSQPFRHYYSSDHHRSRQALLGHLIESEQVILFCSAKDGQGEVVPLVHEAVKLRGRNRGYFAFVSAENRVHAEVKHLASLATASNRFFYCDAMVDRICRKTILGAHGRVETYTEDDFELAILRPPVQRRNDAVALEGLTSDLRRMDASVFDDPVEFDKVKRRKRMMMNTPLLALAILASGLDVKTLGEFYDARAEGDSGRDALESVVGLCSVALAWQQELSEGEQEKWRSRYERRLLDNGDEEIARLLKRLHDGFSVNFLAEVGERLGEVYDELRRHHSSTGLVGVSLKLILQNFTEQIR